jgi:(p)ppGpp synthase/HD superfamily hydrolase
MNTQTVENRATFEARLRNHFSQEDIDEIMLAYDLSKEAHRTHKRDSGERYFEHPRAGVLIMLDELNWYDKDAIIAFLLHDTGEDTPLFGSNKTTFEEFVRTATFRITKIFNKKVAQFVIGLTKPFIDNVQFTHKKELHEYYIDGLRKDPKTLLLKMVDRLHNLRSLKNASIEKTEKTFSETKEVYLKIFSELVNKTEWKNHTEAVRLLDKIKEEMSLINKLNETNPVLYYASKTNYDEDGYADPFCRYYTPEYAKKHPFDCVSTEKGRFEKTFYDSVVENGGVLTTH